LSLLRSLTAVLTLGVLLAPAGLHGQAPASHVRVTAESENFRATPGGARLAVVTSEARLPSAQVQGSWRQVTLSGWVPAATVQATERDGFSLIVARGGADLSAAPAGPAVAHVQPGMLAHERERRGEWVRVERSGWMWNASLTELEAAAEAAAGAPPAAARRVVHRSPGGDTVAVAEGSARLEVLGREGEWSRVRLEGWVRGDLQAEGAAGPLRDVTLTALRDDPERFRGREIALQLQFVSVQQADSMRIDFTPGEHYALTRAIAGGAGFVYVALTPEQVAAFRRLAPLQRLEVVGRVRTARSAQMGHPVLELVSHRLR
jgi:hypothetical protein